MLPEDSLLRSACWTCSRVGIVLLAPADVILTLVTGPSDPPEYSWLYSIPAVVFTGGFLAGLIVPKVNGYEISLTEKLEDFVGLLFLPQVRYQSVE